MPTAYRPGVLQVNLRGRYYGEEVQNTLWVEKVSGLPTALELAEVAIATRDWWLDNLRNIISTNYTLNEIYVADWASGTAATYTETGSLPASGANTNEGVSGNVACVVTIRSGGRGRSSRGRNFVCGLTENVTLGNLFTQAVVDAVQAGYEMLLIVYQPIGYEPVVYSQFSSNAVRTIGEAFPVVAYTVNREVDSMRRRLAGRGR
jgi:hypothetical protein